MRLGVRLPHHAYMLPPNAEVSAAARVAHLQGGVLCVVHEHRTWAHVEMLGEKGDGVVWTELSAWTWTPVGDGGDVRTSEEGHSHVRVLRCVKVG